MACSLCAPRACPASNLRSWGPPCALLAPPPPKPSRRPAPHVAPLSSHASLSTRQLASAFNQPLSFDISSVTTMGYMFYVRSARALPANSAQLGPPCTLLAPPPPHALPPPSKHATLRQPPFNSRQNADALSDANKVLIRCAWAGNAAFDGSYRMAWIGLGACSPLAPPSPSLPPPSLPLPASPPLPPPSTAGDDPTFVGSDGVAYHVRIAAVPMHPHNAARAATAPQDTTKPSDQATLTNPAQVYTDPLAHIYTCSSTPTSPPSRYWGSR